MRKTVLFFMLLIVYSLSTQAQKRSKQLWIGAEFGQPTQSDLKAGYGINFKGLYGVGKTGQLTLSVGYSRFAEKGWDNLRNTPHARLISVLAGYRHNMGNFFVEPQAGIGELGGATYFTIEGDDISRPSVTVAFAAMNMGYTIKRFSFGIRYQVAAGSDFNKADADIWRSKTVSYAGVFVAYRLFAK